MWGKKIQLLASMLPIIQLKILKPHFGRAVEKLVHLKL